MGEPTHILDPDGEAIIVLQIQTPLSQSLMNYPPSIPAKASHKNPVKANHHLILVSPAFKKILTGGSVEITTENWDPEALLILLRILHFQLHIVPRRLILELNAKLWLWISCLFQLRTKFKEATSISMSQSNGWIASSGLPIQSTE
ncbi:uncharacterized protein BDW43DRAFT_296824 [Aspergillus alliaceus]|uniref:uncharacterized protein n=1 Tax=Petromyces alliaceus TaxID=209559 RepID=UPI0012A62F94|nr:uncharacterized protein BDW43DRAFT_296824 [Aspergillus alliaceus]KAB8238647.1 hypothetical protein BDW43DRAFT_296824 [Aspergillus alliaceus]